MKNFVICHNDPDGWISCLIVLIRLTIDAGENTTTPMAAWDYHMPWETLVSDAEEAETIWMVDVTLPDEFMSKFADKIIRIDHHESALNGNFPWSGKLMADYSVLTVPNFVGSDGNQAKQISGCELAWLVLFPGTCMPSVVRLVGRYDVWDHDSENKSRAMFSAILNDVTEKGLPAFLNSACPLIWDENIAKAKLQEGHEFLHHKSLVRAFDCQTGCFKVKCFDHIIAVSNYASNEGSEQFDEIVSKNPDIEGLLKFGYKFDSETWKASCYSIKDEFSALDFIQNFRTVFEPENLLGMGGHKNACGFQFKGNIENFLKTFQKIN